MFWRENVLAGKCFGGEIFLAGKCFGGKNVLAGKYFWREKVLAGKCFGGNLILLDQSDLLFHDLPVDCTAPFEASFVTDAAVDGTAATIANSNRGDPDISGMVLRHLASLIFRKKTFLRGTAPATNSRRKRIL